MLRTAFQSGFLSVFYSLGSNPLQLWARQVKGDGGIRRLEDEEVHSLVLEISGPDVRDCFIACPADEKKSLGIKLPYLVFVMKNLDKFFTFEVQVTDDKGIKRRLRASNFQVETRVKPYICAMPMRLDEGWNQVQLNLVDLVRRAYGTKYVETTRIIIHANCRLRRVYFADRLYSEEELPNEFKLYRNVEEAQEQDARTDVD